LLTCLVSYSVFAEEETELEKQYWKRIYKEKLVVPKISAKIEVRFRSQDELNHIWSTRRFIANDSRHNLIPFAFYIDEGKLNLFYICTWTKR